MLNLLNPVHIETHSFFVRAELVEGQMVTPLMLRQTQHERLKDAV